MPRALAWIAIFLLVFPVPPSGADDEDAGAKEASAVPSLRERLRDMSSEAARFLEGLSESERMSLQMEARNETDATRLRLRMRQLPLGVGITVALRDGERVRGELAGTTEEEFSLNVPHRTGSRTVKLRRTFRYEEVESADLPEAKGWSAAEKIRELPMGKRIELLLLDGSKVRGTLKNVAGRGFQLEVGKNDVREYSFDDVASVRPQGMRTSAKITLAVAIPLAILFTIVKVGEQLES